VTDRFLNTEELAEYLSMPAATLRWWRHRGTGPPYQKLGRNVRYRWVDIETWLNENTVNPREETA
jgi:predicted DNA-binding transcriptional regulator AlpA